MPIHKRPSKSSSGTRAFKAGTSVKSGEANQELDDLTTRINALDGDNVKKISTRVNLNALDDHSDNAATQATATDPGVSDSESLATDLEGEIERLRYAIERLALGIDASRQSSSGDTTTAWIDNPARPGNHVYNGSFEVMTGSVPEGWSTLGSPTLSQVDTDKSEGAGKAIKIVGGGTAEGLRQTLSNLKAATRYELVCRVKVDSGTARVRIFGVDSTSDFRSQTVDVTSSTFTTVKIVIQTDTTVSDVQIDFVDAVTAATFYVDHVGFHECNTDPLVRPGLVVARDTKTGSDQTITAGGGWTDLTNLSAGVTVPGPGYLIRAEARVPFQALAGSNIQIQIDENGSRVGTLSEYTLTDADACTGVLLYINETPTSGTTYTYKVQAKAVTANSTINGAGDSDGFGELWVTLVPAG